jgi:hypothetical protein
MTNSEINNPEQNSIISLIYFYIVLLSASTTLFFSILILIFSSLTFEKIENTSVFNNFNYGISNYDDDLSVRRSCEGDIAYSPLDNTSTSYSYVQSEESIKTQEQETKKKQEDKIKKVESCVEERKSSTSQKKQDENTKNKQNSENLKKNSYKTSIIMGASSLVVVILHFLTYPFIRKYLEK